MRTIEFNGYGQPRQADIVSGAILLLVQAGRVAIVRLEIVPPEEFGPSLDHALNEDQLAADAFRAVEEARPECLRDSSRDWILECPLALAARAQFRG